MNFSQTIIGWYNKNKRDLPWRHTKDPYKIWLSEIILQQTRVQQGLPYYETFVKKFPTVHCLAKVKEDVVMKTWQGLGYYSRARNLHSTAKFISKKLRGKFPNEYNEIIKLKGVGNYTAGAIASFAFNNPHPVVDGNVFRVLSRYFGIKTPIDSTKGKKKFFETAELLLDKKNPGLFNQAIMEFGALQCVPQNPHCGKCPLRKNCKAFSKNLVDVLPIKSKRGNVRTRYFNYLIIRQNGKTLIKKRTENDIWKNLYDFPMIETNKEVSKKELIKKLKPLPAPSLGRKREMKVLSEGEYPRACKAGLGEVKIISASNLFKHFLSHQVIIARFWEIDGSGHKIKLTNGTKEGNHIYITDNQTDKYAFPRLIDRYFEENSAKN